MRIWVVLLLSTLLGSRSCSAERLSTHDDQKVLLGADSFEQPGEHNFYRFKAPIKNVAIIGAGVGGLVAYREFTREGFNVRLFERDDLPGGNWHYTDEVPLPAHYTRVPTEVADYAPDLPPDGADLPYERVFEDGWDEALRVQRGPKPLWETLKSNAAAPVQQITEIPWPQGTEWELPHAKLARYLRSFASWIGVNSNDRNPNVSYMTRVEDVRKVAEGRNAWRLTLRKLTKEGASGYRLTWWTEHFDAVVVAVGRYNAANIPSIHGLSAWADRWPKNLYHSREYRRPDPFVNNTVLIVGAAASGSEIGRELSRYAGKVYQSIRPDNDTALHLRLDFLLSRLPKNVTIVGEIAEFLPPPESPNERISSGQVKLVNGTILTGIDSIIFATGFRYTFPFLPQYTNSGLKSNETVPYPGQQPLVTDGTHVRSLHLDILYIEEPTLGFINLNVGMQSFTYGEYASLALARVWAGKARLPNAETLWKRYWKRVEDRGGHTKRLQFLGGERTEESVRYFVGWLNSEAVKFGGRQLDLLPKYKDEVNRVWSLARYSTAPEERVITNVALDAYRNFARPSPALNMSDRFAQQDLVLDDWW